jgi:hypothetical protein
MPLYNHLKNWNGLDIEAVPAGSWRRRFPFWPFFVGQRVQFLIRVAKKRGVEKDDLSFHFVEKMAEEEKPRMIALALLEKDSSDNEKVFFLQNGSKITSSGEIRYWLSSRGYNVEGEPVFAAEAVCLDSLIVPSLFALIGPILGLILGLIIGLLIGG